MLSSKFNYLPGLRAKDRYSVYSRKAQWLKSSDWAGEDWVPFLMYAEPISAKNRCDVFIDFNFDIHANSIFVEHLYVSKDFRKSGLASLMMAVLFELAVLNGVVFVYLRDASGISGFFESFGFEGVDKECLDQDVLGDDGITIKKKSRIKICFVCEGKGTKMTKKINIPYEDNDFKSIEFTPFKD